MSAIPNVPPRAARLVRQISTPTVIKAAPGTIWRVTVTTAGSELGGVFNAAALDGAVEASQVAIAPNAVGDYRIGWPCNIGIVVVPGSEQTLLVSYT